MMDHCFWIFWSGWYYINEQFKEVGYEKTWNFRFVFDVGDGVS